MRGEQRESEKGVSIEGYKAALELARTSLDEALKRRGDLEAEEQELIAEQRKLERAINALEEMLGEKARK